MPPSSPPPAFRYALLSPRYWLSWLGLGLIWLLPRLPFRLLVAVGRGVGAIVRRALAGKRAQVVRRNLQLCFPQMSDAERERMVDANLRDLGMMLVEFSLACFGSARAAHAVPVEISGLEHLDAAHAQGRGVLLLGGHFSHMELACRFMSHRIRIAAMYRHYDDAAVEWAIKRGRLNNADRVFSGEEVRAAVRYLRNGGTLWYAPDQDMKHKESVFVPFFGIPAATITATHTLARMSGAAVVPFFYRRKDDASGYALHLEPALEDFPGADVVADTARINQVVERMVCAAPTQYFWVHMRFKSRPPGAPPLY
jgi:Kdo2-lipid IVA lauroyltransferase/acyltransferase